MKVNECIRGGQREVGLRSGPMKRGAFLCGLVKALKTTNGLTVHLRHAGDERLAPTAFCGSGDQLRFVEGGELRALEVLGDRQSMRSVEIDLSIDAGVDLLSGVEVVEHRAQAAVAPDEVVAVVLAPDADGLLLSEFGDALGELVDA